MEHTPEKKQAESTKPVSELYQNVRTLASVLAVLILIFTFVVPVESHLPPMMPPQAASKSPHRVPTTVVGPT